MHTAKELHDQWRDSNALDRDALVRTHHSAILSALALKAAVEESGDAVVQRLSGRCANYPDAECKATGQCQCHDLAAASALIVAQKAEIERVKGERESFEGTQLPCNVVVNSTVINKGCRVSAALTAIRQQIKYAQPDVAPDLAAHPKDTP